MENQILEKMKTYGSLGARKRFLTNSIKELQSDYQSMRTSMQYPEPVFNGSQVTYDRLDETFLCIESLKEFRSKM